MLEVLTMSKKVLILSGSPRKGGNCFADIEEKGVILAHGGYEKGETINSPYEKQSYEMGKCV